MPRSALVAALACFVEIAALAQQSSLDRPLQTTLAAAVPLGDRETMLIPRTLVRSAKIPMGFEQADPLPPSSGPRTPQPIAGLTMRQVLDLIVGLDPRYAWREVDGVAVVRPSAAWSNPNDALNRHVQNIHWTSVNARQTLDKLTSVIFDAPVTATPGSVNSNTFAVDVADVMMRSSASGYGLQVLRHPPTSHRTPTSPSPVRLMARLRPTLPMRRAFDAFFW
jgi:hypothetical protein